VDDIKRWHDCTLKEWVNIKVDGLMTRLLKVAMSTDKFIDSVFPNKHVWIEMKGEKNRHPQDWNWKTSGAMKP
jgi:hypothetical protein